MATAVCTTAAARACMSTGATNLFQQTNTAWWMIFTAMRFRPAHGKSTQTYSRHLFVLEEQLVSDLVQQFVVCCRMILRESGYPRYLHSSVLLGGSLLIFGGNTHNDTSLSNGAKCFSADFLAYDIGLWCYFTACLIYTLPWKVWSL